MAKKKVERPKREITRRQLSHWQQQKKRERTSLYINNVPVPLTAFPGEIISSILLTMVACLKGVGEVRSLDIFLRKEPKQG